MINFILEQELSHYFPAKYLLDEGSKWTFREFNMTELLVVTRPTERSRASEAMFTMNFVFKDCKRKSLSIVWTLMNFYVI